MLSTGIWRNTPLAVRLLVRPFTWIMKTAEVGGAAVMNLFGDRSGDGVSGRYFNVQVEEAPNPQARDEALAHELRECGLTWTEGRLDRI